MNVLITGCGRYHALGFNLALRYLESGNHVIATVRKESKELLELKEKYPNMLDILIMDIGKTPSVIEASKKLSEYVSSLDLIINNAVSVSVYNDKDFFECELDNIAGVVDVTSVGALRVVKYFMPFLEKSETTALIVNISSEAGSISTCTRTKWFEYNMAKCALNMGTKMLYNNFLDNPKLNIFAVHPGWVRTNPDSKDAPTLPYDAAKELMELFEKRRFVKDGNIFIDHSGSIYPY